MPRMSERMAERLISMCEGKIASDGHAVLSEDSVTQGLLSRNAIEGHHYNYYVTEIGRLWYAAHILKRDHNRLGTHEDLEAIQKVALAIAEINQICGSKNPVPAVIEAAARYAGKCRGPERLKDRWFAGKAYRIGADPIAEKPTYELA